ncbi:MAG: aminoglycoside adenylyltransferase domain-containing protein [Planctomycetota bacterium]
MIPTPFSDLNDVLERLVNDIGQVLASRFVAAFLQGSFAVGDFDEHSDVDFIVVMDGELTDGQVSSLQDVHGRVFELPVAWAQHLEGSYFPADVLASLARRGEELWYLDNGSRSLIRSEHCNTAVVRQVVVEHGVSLRGPPASSLLEPVPVAVLREEIRRVIVDWGSEILRDPDLYRNRFYQGFIALNFCRMWCDFATGTLGSKRRGVDWAMVRLEPEWGDFLDRAWATRPDPEISVRTPPDPADYRQSLRLVDRVIAAVAATPPG